jgi:hypothetical protein
MSYWWVDMLIARPALQCKGAASISTAMKMREAVLTPQGGSSWPAMIEVTCRTITRRAGSSRSILIFGAIILRNCVECEIEEWVLWENVEHLGGGGNLLGGDHSWSPNAARYFRKYTINPLSRAYDLEGRYGNSGKKNLASDSRKHCEVVLVLGMRRMNLTPSPHFQVALSVPLQTFG